MENFLSPEMKMNIIKKVWMEKEKREIKRKRRKQKSLCARTHIIHWQHKFSVEKRRENCLV